MGLLLACALCVGMGPVNGLDAWAQRSTQNATKTISGTVVDATGATVPGVAIQVTGTSNGVATDFNGRFTLSGVPSGATLTVSSLGYATQEIPVGNAVNLSIVLQEDTNFLDEVVVVGYGTMARRNVSSAIGTVKADLLEERPAIDVESALQGTAANLIIQNTGFDSTNPSMNISIRGIGTISNNDPLLVIDGVPQSSVSRMNDLNPNDIDNVSILKDAGSAAIYGSRSSNGVIIITTKQGKKNQTPVIRFGAAVGYNTPDILLKPVSSARNAEVVNESRTNVGQAPIFTDAEIAEFRSKGDTEMLARQALTSALQQNYNLSISGGSGNTTYMMSAQWFDQASDYANTDYGRDRFTVRSNLRSSWGRWTVGSNISFTRAHTRRPSDADFGDLVRFPTYYWVRTYDPENNVYFKNTYSKWGAHSEVLGKIREGGYYDSEGEYVQGNFNAEYQILEGLKFRAVVGGEVRNFHQVRDQKTFMVVADNGASYGDVSTATLAGSTNTPFQDDQNKSTYVTSQFLLDFNHTFADLHNVSGVVGWSQESYRYYNMYIRKTYLDDLNQPTGSTVIDSGSRLSTQQPTNTALMSWFGRVSYAFGNRYFVDFTARYDQSSKFAKGHRGAFFPAVSASWRISDEPFMEKWNRRMGELKLRTSYGLNGNQQNVGDYDYLSVYSNAQNVYAFNGTSVSGTSLTLGNENLSWEVSKTFNVGIDAGFFKNTLTFSFDWFNKNTEGILFTPQTPSSYGASLANENMGALNNKGWDFTVNYNLRSGSWLHTFGFNLADSNHKITKGYEEANIQVRDISRIRLNGLPMNTYYGLEVQGLFQTQEEINNAAIPTGIDRSQLGLGDVHYVDQNNDGKIDDNDKIVLGYGFPRYTFGLNYSFKWKGFDFAMMAQGVGKRTLGIRGELIEAFQGNYAQTIFEHMEDYWRPDNTDAWLPRVSASGSVSSANNWNTRGSTINYLDMKYIRLKNIQLGYTLPAKWTGAVGIKSARIYVNGQNVLTLSPTKFIDPENTEFPNSMNGGSSHSVRNHPNTHYWGGGINLTF